MRKFVRIAVMLLAICLVFGGIPLSAQAAAHTHALCMESSCSHDNPHIHQQETTWTAWSKTTSLPTDSNKNYYLTGNVTISKQWVPADDLHLCLNGYTITYDGVTASNEYVYGGVRIENGRSVYITNCQNSGGITMSSTASIFVGANTPNALVYINSAELHLYNVDVFGTRGDSAVYAYGNTYSDFTMHGGSIRNCSVYRGALFASFVTAEFGKVNLCGDASIHNNVAPDLGTGGVVLSGVTEMRMWDTSSIRDNTGYNVGGVSLGTQTVLKMFDSSSISGNKGTRDAGGIDNEGIVYMQENASITGNKTVSGDAGGIYVHGYYSNCFFVSGSVNITGNTRASSAPSNVKVPNYTRPIIINGTLNAAAEIGVSMDTPSTFTSGWNTEMSGKTPGDYFFSDSKSYEVRLAGNELTLGDHTHAVTYTLGTTNSANDTLNASCGCGLTGSFTVNAPALVNGSGSAEAAVTGSVTGVSTPSVTYTGVNGTDYAASTDAPTVPGSYRASVTLGGVTAYVDYELTYPTVTAWPTASDLVYGDQLKESVLTGGSANVPGTFTWTDGETAADVGTKDYEVTFTPENPAWKAVTGTVSVYTEQAVPAVITPPTASGITYGDTLADSTLSFGEASVPGGFTWTDDTIKPTAGTHTYEVTFTPDAGEYKSVTLTVTVAVEKAEPSVTWPTASGITYGQSLAESVLTGGSADPSGSFAWEDDSVKPNAGTAAYPVVFTPADTANYKSAEQDVSVQVSAAEPSVITPPTASAITYGDTLSDSTLTGGSASVPGSFAWEDDSVKPNAGTASYKVVFTPDDTNNYAPVTVNVSVYTVKAEPIVTQWPTAADLVYGDALSDSALAGGSADVTGSFVWADETVKPNAGTASYGVTFVPADATNYKSVTGSVSIYTEKAEPTVTQWPEASDIVYGDTLADSALTGGDTSGVFAWKDGSVAPEVGTGEYDVVFTPADENYKPVTKKVSVTVNKAEPTVNKWPSAENIVFGDELSESDLTGGSASVPGSFAWTDGTVIPNSGTAEFEVTFTPDDTDRYLPMTQKVTVMVEKAEPAVTRWPSAGALTYGESLSDSALEGGIADVEGSFAWEMPETKPNAGKNGFTVVFTPTDTNYVPVKMTVEVDTAKAVPTLAWEETSVVRTENGNPAEIPAPAVTIPDGSTYSGEIRYSYAASGSETFLSGLPTAAGTYTVRAEIPESGNFTAASDTLLLNILPKEDDSTGNNDGTGNNGNSGSTKPTDPNRPNTGDNADTGLFLGAFSASLAGLGICLYFALHRKRN